MLLIDKLHRALDGIEEAALTEWAESYHVRVTSLEKAGFSREEAISILNGILTATIKGLK